MSDDWVVDRGPTGNARHAGLVEKVDALLANTPGPKGMQQRVRRTLIELGATTPEEIRALGAMQFLRCPNFGLQTLKWLTRNVLHSDDLFKEWAEHEVNR